MEYIMVKGIGINSLQAGPVIVSNKNWNILIKWAGVIGFWTSAILREKEIASFLSFLLCSWELCL